MRVLVLNSGSSSIKYQLVDMTARTALEGGLVERIGTSGARLVHRRSDSTELVIEFADQNELVDHRAAFEQIVDCLAVGAEDGAVQLDAIGHRVVHGGDVFRVPTLIDDRVVAEIQALVPLAPLHNPPNLRGIEVARAQWPQVPQVAVFDTAFHATMPPRAFRYAVPRAWYETHGVRRYGFHGTSHSFVAKEAARFLDRPLRELKLITLHLGNGASAAAIDNGKCIDTSMGLTPLEGLVMGTRGGDVDPGVILYMASGAGTPLEDIESGLNKESGLRGLCGLGDVRDVIAAAEAGNADAGLALEVYTYRIRKYVGAYAAVLGRVDGLVFTGGVGENSAEVRSRVCTGLEAFGMSIDEAQNQRVTTESRAIDRAVLPTKILVVPTNEELEIAEQTIECVHSLSFVP